MKKNTVLVVCPNVFELKGTYLSILLACGDVSIWYNAVLFCSCFRAELLTDRYTYWVWFLDRKRQSIWATLNICMWDDKDLLFICSLINTYCTQIRMLCVYLWIRVCLGDYAWAEQIITFAFATPVTRVVVLGRNVKVCHAEFIVHSNPHRTKKQ
jgi:hypothetical protein